MAEWPVVLEKARRMEFDRLERIATMAGVVLVAWQIKPVAAVGASALFAYLFQFVYLAPVLLLALGPFQVRRVRRGLDQAARNRDTESEATHGEH